MWVLTTEGEQFVDWNVQSIGGITPEENVHELRRESVKSCLHRGVRSKEIPRAGCRKGNVKRYALTLHEVPRSFQYNECSVTFIEMANVGLLSERAQQAPSPNPQHDLLGHPHLWPTAVKFTCNAAIRRRICRVIGVEQIEMYTPYPDLPGAKPQTKTRQIDSYPQKFPIRLSHGPDW